MWFCLYVCMYVERMQGVVQKEHLCWQGFWCLFVQGKGFYMQVFVYIYAQCMFAIC